MAFDAAVVKDGRGRALRLDFSYDGFTSIAYRYSDVAGQLDGVNWYEPRLVKASPLRRAFGQDNIAASGTIDIEIDNTDAGADWLNNRTSFNNVAKTRVRIYLALYDLADPATFDAKLLGEFVIAQWPKRTNSSIQLSLSDDVLGALTDGVVLPTMGDWELVGTATTNPFYNAAPSTRPGVDASVGGYPEGVIGLNTPIQLAFGEDWVRAMPHLIPGDPLSGTYLNQVIVPVCCTDELVTTAPNFTALRIQIFQPDGSPEGGIFDIPSSATFAYTDNVNPASITIWTAEFSPNITRDGKTFRVAYLRVNTSYFAYYMQSIVPGWPGVGVSSTNNEPNSPVSTLYNSDCWFSDFVIYTNRLGVWHNAPSCYRMGAAGVSSWFVKGYPLSARTHTTDAEQHAVDVLTDIVTHYTKKALTIDSTSAAAVKSATPEARCSGVIQPWDVSDKSRLFGLLAVQTQSLRAVVSKICQSADIDIFINWSGNFAFSQGGNFTPTFVHKRDLGYLVAMSETELDVLSDWVPDEGQRGAPYNRVTVEGGVPYTAERLDAPNPGPFDLTSPAIAIADKVLTHAMQIGWRPQVQQRQSPELYRYVETHIRPRLRFRCALQALRLDLGDYFTVTWSRNLGGPYAATIFQLDTINYSAATDEVECEAQWRDELATDNGYLLDDETLLVRVASTAGRTVTVESTITQANFASGSLISDGVVAGDILLLLDSTCAATEFTRYRALIIASVSTATSLQFQAGADLDFGNGGSPIAVADWKILHGATTYPTVSTDPTNYPDGGAMYGKMTNSSGAFSDTSTGNRLLNG